MAGTKVTTREVAKLLSVSEATVKRWADDGMIQFEKTVGGHRRFGLEEIASFRRSHDTRTKSPIRSMLSATESKTAIRALPATLLDYYVQGYNQAAADLLINAYLRGHRLTSIFDSAMTPTMHRIGRAWSRGDLTIADEHLATRTAILALQKLHSAVQTDAAIGLTALVCGVESDLHELVLHMIQMMLEVDGWAVRNLGPNTPFFTLSEAVVKHKPQLVCISAKLLNDPDRATRDYEQVRKITSKSKIAVAIGGDGFADRLIRDRFPAEFYAEDLTRLLEFSRTLKK
jgi:excisionase family DNA binding protein